MAPKVPTSDEARDLAATVLERRLSEAAAWFGDAARLKKAGDVAKETKTFLVSNKRTVDHTGKVDTRGGRWWPARFGESPDEITLDLRRVRMRQLALSHGLAHFLGRLIEEQVLDASARAHIDDATDLAALNAHERLMEIEFEGLDDRLNLGNLQRLFLRSEKSNPEVHSPWIARMHLMGLWASPGRKLHSEWRIGIGPMAKIFHLQAYGPAVLELSADKDLN